MVCRMSPSLDLSDWVLVMRVKLGIFVRCHVPSRYITSEGQRSLTDGKFDSWLKWGPPGSLLELISG